MCCVQLYKKCSERSKLRDMALKKVKGNFERMFDKNLTDLVRGIRNNKDNEVMINGSVCCGPQVVSCRMRKFGHNPICI